jgi:hypothetical protein
VIPALLHLGARACAWLSSELCRASRRMFTLHNRLLMGAIERDPDFQALDEGKR